MRALFKEYLLSQIQINPELIVVTADLGYKMWDEVRDKHPKNFLNVGAAEQLMLGICTGLSYSGKIPVAYSITPFLLYRGAEILRNYIGRENLNVKLVGSGLFDDYKHDGFSHQDNKFVEACDLLSIKPFIPSTKESLKEMLPEWLEHKGASFLGLRR